jgi:hypothetical protein
MESMTPFAKLSSSMSESLAKPSETLIIMSLSFLVGSEVEIEPPATAGGTEDQSFSVEV